MTDREKLINSIDEILLMHGSLSEEIRNRIFLELEKYEISRRTTELTVADPDANENIIKEFAISKAAAGRSQKTIRQYVLALRRYERVIKKKLIESSAGDIRKYTAIRMTKDGLGGRSLLNERRYLSAFFDWAVNSELMARNPVRQIETIKVPKLPKKAFSDIEVEKIRNACRTLKEKALIEMLLSTACRISEAASVLTGEIDGNRILICGKGNKYGTVYLESKAMLAIETYIGSRTDNNPYLFPGRDNKHLCTTSLERIVKKVGERAGISNVHPHRFRRTAATQALRRGMSIEMVSRFLRHENIQTTMLYLDITERDLQYQHERFIG